MLFLENYNNYFKNIHIKMNFYEFLYLLNQIAYINKRMNNYKNNISKVT